MQNNVISRSLHDVGLAAWFGGTLANAVALNRAAAAASDARSTGAVSNAGWDAWTPVNAVAIGAHLVGSVGMLRADRGRVATDSGATRRAPATTASTVTFASTR